MRLDPRNLDKYAAMFKAGGRRTNRRPPSSRSKPAKPAEASAKQPDPTENFDDEIAPGTRLHKTAKERQLEAIKNEDRHWKRYLANRQSRLDRLTSEVPGAGKFLRAIARAAPTISVVAYRDVDADLAGLAQRCRVADIPNAYDRFTLYEETVSLLTKAAPRSERSKFAEAPSASFFSTCGVTALDELKEELRLK